DARVSRVTVNGAVVNHRMVPIGDVQRAEAVFELALNTAEIVFSVEEGTDVYVEPQPIRTGAANEGMRVVRSRADAAALHLTLEGRSGRAYILSVRTPRRLGAAAGVRMLEPTDAMQRVEIQF